MMHQRAAFIVMAGLGPAIHVFASRTFPKRGWQASRPAMTDETIMPLCRLVPLQDKKESSADASR
jgi:hypothetical protein